jgi:hypothetical protein
MTVCASRSLLHRRAGLCDVRDYFYSFIRVTGYGLRMFGTKVVAVPVVWIASALEALSEGRRMSREASAAAAVRASRGGCLTSPLNAVPQVKINPLLAVCSTLMCRSSSDSQRSIEA